jgi:leucyl-tRNA synthetase
MMFPYPSGALHFGHVANYTIGDVLVRYRLMRGCNVLSPMGWDALGLPAENAAIDAGIHPAVWTRKNIQIMKGQMRQMGLAYDWTREISTAHPEYYRWTQWIFLRMFARGLAYKADAIVNWDPVDQTVVANEQVDSEGRAWRSGALVEKRRISQWFLKTTAYAQRLLDDLDLLEGWPENVRKQQAEWIGRSEGARVDFTVDATGETLSVFTTRPDTLWGVTFMSLAPEHPLIERLLAGTRQKERVMAEVDRMRRQSFAERASAESEKFGVDTGFTVTNPVNGESVPLWVANYALMDYGTGAVMAVPAHDQRDFEFARKYDIPVKAVIQPPEGGLRGEEMTEAFVEDGVQADGGPFEGMSNRRAIQAIIHWLDEKNIGAKTINYRLRDWGISRQRYWGVPIPVIYEQDGTINPVPEDQLPVIHPRDVEFTGRGGNPLARSESFVNVVSPVTGKPARRETDTMDTFVDSSWYYLRYISARNGREVFSAEDVNRWLPVDQYVGGIEHAVMHLLYSRFFTKFLYDEGLVQFSEPFQNLFCQGMVQKTAYRLQERSNAWVPQAEVDLDKMIHRDSGKRVVAEMSAMSKSRHNGVSPEAILEKYGADTAHAYALFMGPPEKDKIYQEDGLIGVYRWLTRVWETFQVLLPALADGGSAYQGDGSALNAASRALRRKAHQSVDYVTRVMEGWFQFNTAISRLMEFTTALVQVRNAIDRGQDHGVEPSVLREALEIFVKLLAPFTPHLGEELFARLGGEGSVFRSGWPGLDEAAAREELLEVPVQVRGKVRARVEVPADIDDESLKEKAREAVAAAIAGKEIVKEIVVRRGKPPVPNLVNLVVK